MTAWKVYTYIVNFLIADDKSVVVDVSVVPHGQQLEVSLSLVPSPGPGDLKSKFSFIPLC